MFPSMNNLTGQSPQTLASLTKESGCGDELRKRATMKSTIFDYTEDEEISKWFTNVRLEVIDDANIEPADMNKPQLL